MKKMKISIFLIISLISFICFSENVYATDATRCIYSGTEDGENFTITYSVSPNGKGSATITSIDNSHSKIKLANSYVYGKEFITNGDTIICPKYLTYKVVKEFLTTPTMKVGFRSNLNYKNKMELSNSSNDNKSFSIGNVSIINTCSYETGSGRVYVEAYTDGTVQAQLSSQNYDSYKFNVTIFDTLKSNVFTTKSCPNLGIGYNTETAENGNLVYTTYISPDGLYDREVFNTESKKGTKLPKTGDDIAKEMTSNDVTQEGDINWGEDVTVDCDGILGKELLDFIDKIFRWIQIIAPIFVIIMGSVEFAGAVLQDDKDAMKKASNKFIKRLIIAVALFFVPLILKFLLNIFSEFSSHSADICGIGE